MFHRVRRWLDQVNSTDSDLRNGEGSYDPAIDNFRPDDADPQLQQWKDAARYQLDRQFEAMEGFDRRLGQTLTLASTVLPISFALLNLNDGQLTDRTKWLFFAALGFYLLLLVLNFLFSRRYADITIEADLDRLSALIDEGKSASAIEGWIASEYTAATKLNDEVLSRKSAAVFILNYCFFLESICIIAAAFSAAGINVDWINRRF